MIKNIRKMISENQLPLSKMRTYIEGGGQILPDLPTETGAEYRAKNREIKSRDRCDSHHVREDVLDKTYNAAFEEMIGAIDEIVAEIEETIDTEAEKETKIQTEKIENEILEIQKRIMAIHKQYSKKKISETDYYEQIENGTKELRDAEKRRELLVGEATKQAEVRLRLQTITSVCDAGGITAIDDNMVRAITEYIVVNDDGIEIHLKCGAVITKEYVK